MVPGFNSDFFRHISRAEYWEAVALTQEAYDNLFSNLNDLNPLQSPARANDSTR
jgi:hypothetical protein